MAYKKNNITSLVVMGVIVLIGVAVVFAVVSQNMGTASTDNARARAGEPAVCTKPGTKGIISKLPGTVLSKDATNNTFVADIGAPNDKRNRVVYSCNSTAWVRAKGGGLATDLVPMTFADLSVGDKVVIDGNYIDKDKTTIYPMTIQDMSLHPEHFRGDVSAVGTGELTLTGVVNGPAASLKVLITTDKTRCYEKIKFRDITKQTAKVTCAFVVGDRVEVDGIYSDVKATLVGPYAQIVKHPRD